MKEKKINTKDVLKDIGKHFIRLLKYACMSVCLYVCGFNRVLPHGVTMFPLKATDILKISSRPKQGKFPFYLLVRGTPKDSLNNISYWCCLCLPELEGKTLF